MSPQLSCSDTYQIWKWYSIGNQCFDNGEKLGKTQNGENWFSNPRPRLWRGTKPERVVTYLPYHHKPTWVTFSWKIKNSFKGNIFKNAIYKIFTQLNWCCLPCTHLNMSSFVVSAADILPTLFNLLGKPLKLISSNHTWLTYGCGKIFGHPFRWPLVKVTKLPKREAIDLVPTIK